MQNLLKDNVKGLTRDTVAKGTSAAANFHDSPLIKENANQLTWARTMFTDSK